MEKSWNGYSTCCANNYCHIFPPAWGLVSATATAWTVTYTVIVGLTILNAFMTLDGMYANGVATGAMMGVLDTIFNDLLNFDDLIGSDFDKFDKNNEDYAQKWLDMFSLQSD